MFYDLSQIQEFLKELSLFNSLDDSQIQQIASLFTIQSKGPDELIVVEGEPGDNFYLIFNGQVAVSERVNDQDAYLDILEEGDFFGEEPLLLHRLRSTSARAISPVVLLTTTAEFF